MSDNYKNNYIFVQKTKNLLYKSLYDYMRDERGGFIMEAG